MGALEVGIVKSEGELFDLLKSQESCITSLFSPIASSKSLPNTHTQTYQKFSFRCHVALLLLLLKGQCTIKPKGLFSFNAFLHIQVQEHIRLYLCCSSIMGHL